MLIPTVVDNIHCNIFKIKHYWRLQIRDEYYNITSIDYIFPDGAFKRLEIELQRAYWRIRAREIIPTINIRTLSAKESTFVYKMIKNNCIGISKKQYGYLKGLQERNLRCE